MVLAKASAPVAGATLRGMMPGSSAGYYRTTAGPTQRRFQEVVPGEAPPRPAAVAHHRVVGFEQGDMGGVVLRGSWVTVMINGLPRGTFISKHGQGGGSATVVKDFVEDKVGYGTVVMVDVLKEGTEGLHGRNEGEPLGITIVQMRDHACAVKVEREIHG